MPPIKIANTGENIVAQTQRAHLTATTESIRHCAPQDCGADVPIIPQTHIIHGMQPTEVHSTQPTEGRIPKVINRARPLWTP